MQLWRFGKFNICKVGQWARDHGRADVTGHVQRQPSGRIPSSLGEISVFLLRSSSDGVRPTHIMESNLLSSKSIIDLNVNFI